jgi:hypothetical protein
LAGKAIQVFSELPSFLRALNIGSLDLPWERHMNRIWSALLLSSAVLTAHAEGDASRGMSDASAFLAESSAVVVVGSMAVLAGAGAVVVKSVEASGEVATVVLQGASNGAEASIKLTGKAAKSLSVGAGRAVTVSVLASGYLLVASEQVLAFVPNELGKAILYHAPVSP